MTYGFKMANNVTDLRVTGKRSLSYLINSVVVRMENSNNHSAVSLNYLCFVPPYRYAERCGGRVAEES